MSVVKTKKKLPLKYKVKLPNCPGLGVKQTETNWKPTNFGQLHQKDDETDNDK